VRAAGSLALQSIMSSPRSARRPSASCTTCRSSARGARS
jgi:hypothetical protein